MSASVVAWDSIPQVPSPYKLKSHQVSGRPRIDPHQVSLWLAGCQVPGAKVLGRQVYEEARLRPALGVCHRDQFLAAPALLPKEWEEDPAGNTVYICFYATIFEAGDNDAVVPVLFKDRRRQVWVGCELWLGSRDWDDTYLAAEFDESV